MNVLLTGGTGMIGSHLRRALLADGHRVWVLSRSPQRAPLPGGAQAVVWDGRSPAGWGGLVNEMDAVVNLAGEPLAHWPWTAARKQKFWDSRVNAGRALSEAIAAAEKKPRVLIQASGINHYGLSGEMADEATPPGEDFLARLTVAWEESTRPVEAAGVRRAVIRLGVVLARGDGLLPLMALPARLFAGGRLGSGRQFVPWVHINDVTAAILFLLNEESAGGPFNVVAPQTVTNEMFYRLLCRQLKRPYWLPTPAFLLRLALGEMSVLVLDGRAARPRRLQEAGFEFTYTDLATALAEAL
ncbi:MAG: TIGR01777 family oxidoreductase [Anaerolineales bacterium]